MSGVPGTIRVLIAEDSLLVSEGLRRIVEAEPDLEVACVCGDLESMLEGGGRVHPDIVLTDIRMPPDGADEGIRAAAMFRDNPTDVPALVLSQYDEPEYALKLLERGALARGYLLKNRVLEPDQLAAAMREVARGGSVIGLQLTGQLSRFTARTIFGLTVALLVGTSVLVALTPVNNLPEELQPGPAWLLTPAYLLVLAATGALIASRRSSNFIGWVMCTAAALGALVELGHSYSLLSLANGNPGLLGVEWLAWLARLGELPGLMLQGVYLPMLFPEGRPFKRWGWLLWAAALTALVGVAGEALDPDLLTALKLRNPLAVPDPNGYLGVVGDAAEWMLIGIAIAALASVFIRLKRATGEHRQQLKWVGAALGLLVTTLTGATVADATSSDANFPWLDGLVGLAFLTVPVSVAFAVLRYRLYDIDLVINRTLVYGTLMTVTLAVYLLAVVGIGAVLGFGNNLNLMLSLLATAVVALAFEPARQRVQNLANRLAFGRRASPYDALAVLSRRVAEIVPSEVLLGDMARAVCDAVGVRSASFWLRADRELSLLAGWPPDLAHGTPDLSVPQGGGRRWFSVQNQGKLLGAISIAVPSGRALSASDDRLLADVANQAGLVLSNLGLAADLMARVAELKDSRRRLVTAEDEERRRIERNLHDGAQQHLFGLKVNIRHIRTLLERDQVAASTALERLEEEAEETLQEKHLPPLDRKSTRLNSSHVRT